MLARPLFVAVVAAVVCSALPQSLAAQEKEHTKDSLATVQEKIKAKQAVLVDVREQTEWDKGHIDGAVLVPLGDLAKRSKDPEFVAALHKKLPQDKILYCHCAKGVRAALAAEPLEKLGYQVRPLKPGYKELLQAGFPPAKVE